MDAPGDAPATAMITLVPAGDNGAGDAVTMPREVARAQSDTLAAMMEGGSHGEPGFINKQRPQSRGRGQSP